MYTFTPIRSLLLNRYLLLQTWVVVCMAIVGCTSQQQTPTQEQKQQGQEKQEQSQPAQTQQAENQQGQDQDEEVQMGQEVFNELKAKGEIIESSPLYDKLKPIEDRLLGHSPAQPSLQVLFGSRDAAERLRYPGRECLRRGFTPLLRKKQGATRRHAVS